MEILIGFIGICFALGIAAIVICFLVFVLGLGFSIIGTVVCTPFMLLGKLFKAVTK